MSEPYSRVVGLKAWRVFHVIPREAWATARELAEALGDLTPHDVAGAIRAKLIPRYVKRREDPDDRGIIPRRYQYQRVF